MGMAASVMQYEVQSVTLGASGSLQTLRLPDTLSTCVLDLG